MASDEDKLKAFIILTALLTILGCLTYTIFTTYIKRQEHNRREDREILAARARILLEQRLEQQLMEQAEQDQTSPVNQALRMDLILDALEFETVTPQKTLKGMNRTDDEQASSGSQIGQTKRRSSLRESITEAQKQPDNNECCICLEPYKDGQVVCSARTSECDHIFHEGCALQWLLEHEQCPLCRVTLIQNNKTHEETV